MHERKHRSACVYYTELAQKKKKKLLLLLFHDARASIRRDRSRHRFNARTPVLSYISLNFPRIYPPNYYSIVQWHITFVKLSEYVRYNSSAYKLQLYRK